MSRQAAYRPSRLERQTTGQTSVGIPRSQTASFKAEQSHEYADLDNVHRRICLYLFRATGKISNGDMDFMFEQERGFVLWNVSGLAQPSLKDLAQYTEHEIEQFAVTTEVLHVLNRNAYPVYQESKIASIPKDLLKPGFVYFSVDENSLKLFDGKEWVHVALEQAQIVDS